MLQIFTRKQRGFTLIELLVVIAIIGILAGIALTALGGARNRAKDARIIGEMGQFRYLAEIIYVSDGDYDCLCTTPPSGCTTCHGDVSILSTDINNLNGVAGPPTIIKDPLNTGAIKYCIAVQLNSGGYCVDSAGTSQRYRYTVAVAPIAAIVEAGYGYGYGDGVPTCTADTRCPSP